MKLNYTQDIAYVLNSHIYEYDISKANINILYYYGKISKEEYKRLYNADRMERQKTVGIMELKDKEVYQVIKNGVLEMRENLIKQNNIYDENILSCKNDALFIINQQPEITKFGNVEFKLKNIYTSFFKLKNLEFYYYNSNIDNMEKLDIKGINDNKLKLHEDYMIDFFKTIFDTIDNNIDDSIMIIRNFYNQYLSNQLPLGYYRNFNSESMFSVNVYDNIYDMNMISERDLEYIYKNYNLDLIRELWGIVTHIKFKRK